MATDSSSDMEKAPVTDVRAGPADIAGTCAARAALTFREGQRLMRRIDLHVMPLLILAYLLKNIDGNAISYVKSMNSTGALKNTNITAMLHMTTDQYSYLATIFQVAFVLTEVPSNMLFKRAGPRWHFTRILVLWSTCAAVQAACKNAAGLYAARFFLGLFEGGLYPGIFVYLTNWYRPDEIGVRFACINVLGQFSGVFNALISYGLSFVSGKHGLVGWQALFIIEGCAGIVLAFFVWLFLPDFPDSAKFLSETEREWVQARLPPNSARASDASFSWKEAKMAFTDPVTIGFGFLTLLYNSASSGYQFWLPSIISSFGFTGPANSQLLNIPPALIFVIAGVTGAYICDHSVRVPRAVWILINNVAAIAIFCGLAFVKHKPTLYALICLASIPCGWTINIYWPWRTQTLKGSTHAAVSLAFQNSIGGMAGFYTAQIFRARYAPRYTIPFILTLMFWALMGICACILWYLTYDTEKQTRIVAGQRRSAGKTDNVVVNDEIEVDEKVAQRTY